MTSPALVDPPELLEDRRQCEGSSASTGQRCKRAATLYDAALDEERCGSHKTPDAIPGRRPPRLPDVVRAIADVRAIPYDWLITSVAEGLAEAVQVEAGAEGRVSIDPQTGAMEIFERRLVVAEVANPASQIALGAAPSGHAVGDFFDRPVKSGDLHRRAQRATERVLLERVLEFEWDRVFARYKALEGTLVEGLVQREVDGHVYVLLDADGNEAVLPRWERSPLEQVAINQILTCELQSVRKTTAGPVAELSRASANFVRLLVDDPNVIAVGRVPGYRTVVLTNFELPSVQAVRALLAGERIWTTGSRESPADIAAAVIGAQAAFAIDEHRAIIVETERAGYALQSDVAIAAQLTGWTVLVAEPGRADEVLDGLESRS